MNAAFEPDKQRMNILRKMSLAPRLKLHVLTDHTWSRGRDMLTVASAALAGGATVIQLRDKLASTRHLVEEGQALRVLTRECGALLIVNDRIDVALAIDADGVHIGQDEDMPASLARQLLGPERILGISAGNMAEVKIAVAANADYVSIGPIQQTRVKADAGPPIGTTLLRKIAVCVPMPIIAIGGITVESVREIIQAGAIGVAVISAVVGAEDITASAQNFSTVIQEALTSQHT
ncbi:MAG: thiamine phosphate synthase [Ktedonobacteraceae bacterium]